MSSFHSTLQTQIETAITAVITALATGESTVEYTIRNRSHRVEPSSELLERLYLLHSKVERNATRANTSPFRLAKLGCVSKTGSN